MFLEKIAYCKASRFVPFANYYQGYEIEVNETWRGVCGGDDKCIDDLVVKAEGNNPRGISSRRCEDNNKLTLEYDILGRKGVEWIYLASNRKKCQAVGIMVLNNLLLQNAENILNISRTMGFSRRSLLHTV
jgi:hypothetical protein